jgi:hypothetical protein
MKSWEIEIHTDESLQTDQNFLGRIKVSISTSDSDGQRFVNLDGKLVKKSIKGETETVAEKFKNIEELSFRLVNLENLKDAGATVVSSESEFLLAPYKFSEDNLINAQSGRQEGGKTMTLTVVDPAFMSFVKGKASANDLVSFFAAFPCLPKRNKWLMFFLNLPQTFLQLVGKVRAKNMNVLIAPKSKTLAKVSR